MNNVEEENNTLVKDKELIAKNIKNIDWNGSITIDDCKIKIYGQNYFKTRRCFTIRKRN